MTITLKKLSKKMTLPSARFDAYGDALMFDDDDHPPGGTPILGHIRDVRPEWVSFPGRKPADRCKFFTKNLRMGHNFDIMLPGNG